MIIKKIFFLLILLASFGATYAREMVLVLNGTSSSGKSSIAKELVGQLNDELVGCGVHPFVLLAADTFYAQRDEQALGQDADDALIEDGKLITNQMTFFQEIKEHVLRGDNVVVDGIFAEEEQALLSTMLENIAYVHFVAVYCSPRVLVDHVHQRNLMSSIDEQRSLRQAVLDLPVVWEIVVNPCDEVDSAVDELAFTDLSFIVRRVREEFVADVRREASSANSGEHTDLEIDQAFVDAEVRSVEHKLAHDFASTPEASPVLMRARGTPFCIVNAGRNTPAECAGKIVAEIKKVLGKSL